MFKELADSFCASILDLAEPDQTKTKQVMDEIEQTIIKGSETNKRDGNTGKGANNQE